MKKLVFILIIIISPFLTFAQTQSKILNALQTANEISELISGSKEMRTFYEQRKDITDKLNSINDLTAKGKVTVENYDKLKRSYGEIRNYTDEFIEQVNKDVASYNTFNSLRKVDLEKVETLISGGYKTKLGLAVKTYESSFKPIYDNVVNAQSTTGKSKSLALLIPALIKYTPIAIQLIKTFRDKNRDVKEQLFTLATGQIQNGIRKKLAFPEWESVVTNTPAAYTQSNSPQVDTEDTTSMYRFVDAAIGINLKGHGEMAFRKNGSSFSSADSYSNATQYKLNIRGYGYAAVLAYNYDDRKWEQLCTGQAPTANQEIDLPEMRLRKEQFFTIDGKNRGPEQFMVLLSNSPINAGKLNAIAQIKITGTSVIDGVSRIIGANKVVKPEVTNDKGHAMAPVSIQNMAIDDIIIPMYFEIRRK